MKIIKEKVFLFYYYIACKFLLLSKGVRINYYYTIYFFIEKWKVLTFLRIEILWDNANNQN